MAEQTKTEQSKFVLTFDRSANEINRRPHLKGEYKLAGEEISTTLALWSGQQKANGRIYAKGQATLASITDALRAGKSQADIIDGPPNLDLKVGEIILFENDQATPENRKPKLYGYAREQNRYVRLAAWEHGNSYRGSAEPYRPSLGNEEFPLPSPELE